MFRKLRIKDFSFLFKSALNSFSWKIEVITGTFLLFKNVFNMNKYVLGLMLQSNIFFCYLWIAFLFLMWRLMNLLILKGMKHFKKLIACVIFNIILVCNIFNWLKFDLAVYPFQVFIIKCNSFMRNEIWKCIINCFMK